MIQARSFSGATYDNNAYLNLNDVVTLDPTIRPLIQIQSQQTHGIKNFMPTTMTLTNKERYVDLYWVASYGSSESLILGVVLIGSVDFPFGMYDMTIFNNSSNSNLDPSGLTTIYTGLINWQSLTSPEVIYYQELGNDDTNSVYITT